ncbi:MAG: DUF541 domain-containing protein [Methanocalculus sp. MSAO_Arc2]|uniref:SIMPL domain-containing protein n=1 Tax=Methanocalculus sp. MSAO_Arc2 TaxID=2293855 RepID=UPI000FECFAF4|nr:MAG: DUF541 domain-containing protein [Methanocalculus sp. MSAO_Arc2]
MRIQICALLLALFMVISMIALPVSAKDQSNERVIQTRATGEITTSPDRAEISFAVVTEDPDVRVAQRENAEKMDRCIQALKRAGLTSDDMKTTGYSIHQVTKSIDPWTGERLQDDKQVEVYRVSNTLLITLKDIDRAGEMIDIAVDNGANRVNYISFTLSEEKQRSLRAEALQLAVKKSRADADVVALALGLAIRDVKEVVIDPGYYPMTRSAYDAAMGVPIPEIVPTPIQPGDVTVTASVSISYIC